MKTQLVTALKRHATKIIAGLKVEKTPILITQHGQPAAYLEDYEGTGRKEENVGLTVGTRW